MPPFDNDPVVSTTSVALPGYSGGVFGSSTQFIGVEGVTSAAFQPAVAGLNKNQSNQAGVGVLGRSRGTGVLGESETWFGVVGASRSATGAGGVYGEGAGGGPGVVGVSMSASATPGESWHGVYGETTSATGGAGVFGIHKGNGTGVAGVCEDAPLISAGESIRPSRPTGGAGVSGTHKGSGMGVTGISAGGEGVHSESNSVAAAAIAAYNLNPAGRGPGIHGESLGVGAGVFGKSRSGPALLGISASFEGLHAETNSDTAAAVFAKQSGKGHAGFFVGSVWIDGELTVKRDVVLLGADCAEDFDIGGGAIVDPGSVMVANDDGELEPCQRAYDRRVAGVISGGGDFKPALILDKQPGTKPRQPIALIGKVFCKVDASLGPVEIGDLLTTSATPGHAMKATDPAQSFGAVIGKALRPLRGGVGLVPILVALQ